MSKKKNRKWSKFRHRFLTWFLKLPFKIVMKIRYGIKYKKFKSKEPYLVLSNHQTVVDQFIIAFILNNRTYYVMSDDVASIPFLSKLLDFALKPIPYKKSSTDFGILRNCKKIAEEKCNIVIFPEGNRTYSGKTEHINPTIAKMIKFIKLPIAFVQIRGGYGVSPRFGEKPRKGPFNVSVVKTYSYNEYKDMSDEELNKLIKEQLYVDESIPDHKYRSKRLAEYLERAIYQCPTCGVTHFESNKDILKCTTCSLELRYRQDKQFETLDGSNPPFKNVNEWYNYQQETLLNTNLSELDENKVIINDEVKFLKFIPRVKKEVIYDKANIYLYSNRIEIKSGLQIQTFMFDDIISAGCFGKNKISIFLRDDNYQIKGSKRFNGLKYIQYIYKSKMEKSDNKTDIFFGL